MKVLRIGYLGLRTPETERMTWFFRDVLGLEAAAESETATFLRLPTHQRDFVEVYAEQHDDERLIPSGVDFAVAFVVDDLEQALAEVRAAGLEVIGDVVWAAEAFGQPSLVGVGWFFVRGPDGRAYVLEQIPD